MENRSRTHTLIPIEARNAEFGDKKILSELILSGC